MKITLEGKVTLISGGGAGIGRAIVTAFSELGAQLVVAEIDPAKCEALRKSYPEALVVQCDVRKPAEVAALAAQVEQRFGKLNVLVNNVGHHLGVFKELTELTDQDWEDQHAINLRHMFVMSRAFIPLMKKAGPGGSIINFSSVEGFRGCPYNVGYTTFKHAVRGFTESLAMELSNYGIRVNNIAPETTDTEQVPIAQVYKPEYQDVVGRTIPLGRLGRPEDHAGAAVYLATELSAWVTGSSLLVDGGTLPQGPFHRLPSGMWSIAPLDTPNSAHDRE
jgi:NAD(P)-dependent dehydrogenase (short-subunit alcohol dehydrogenase family)